MTGLVEILKFFLPLAGAAIAWLYDQGQRRTLDQYQRKETQYRELLLSVRGFYTGTQDTKLKQAFLDQVNLCWLYCPDDVIRKAYALFGDN